MNLLSNVKKLPITLKEITYTISFSNIVIRKDKKNWKNLALIQTQGLKIFVRKKNIGLIHNENLKENHLGIKKLHLNKKGNTLFCERDISQEEYGVSDDSTVLQSDVKKSLKNIRIKMSIL